MVPQGMSYAKLAGLPNVYGLYGAFVPVMIYAALGSSPQLVSHSTAPSPKHAFHFLKQALLLCHPAPLCLSVGLSVGDVPCKVVELHSINHITLSYWPMQKSVLLLQLCILLMSARAPHTLTISLPAMYPSEPPGLLLAFKPTCSNVSSSIQAIGTEAVALKQLH